MHNNCFKKYYLRISAVTLACIIHMAAWSQDSSGYPDSLPAVPEVEGVCVPLATVADDGKGPAGKAAAVGIGVVVHAHGIVRHDSVSR